MPGPYDSCKGDLLERVFGYIIENPGISIYELLEELAIEYEIGYMLIDLLDGQGRIRIVDDLYKFESWKNLRIQPVTRPGMEWCAICHQEKPFDEIWDMQEGRVCCTCLPAYETWKFKRAQYRKVMSCLNSMVDTGLVKQIKRLV